MSSLCGRCFEQTVEENGICTSCGYDDKESREKSPSALPVGTILFGRYIVGRVLGQGGFGITYLAKDHASGSLVAVKEFFPENMAARSGRATVKPFTGERGSFYNYGKQCFLEEAQIMAMFRDNPGVARVDQFFEENETCYYVMEYVTGISFQEYIRSKGGRLSWDDIMRVMEPVMDVLAVIHAQNYIHRDVTPDNIYITENGTIKLLDFGAARYSLGNVSHSLDVVLKHGFAPREQYSRHGHQGAYTDVYAVAATIYFCLTGHAPQDSIDREDCDELIPLRSWGVELPLRVDQALMQALSVRAEDRFQNINAFHRALTSAPVSELLRTQPAPEPKEPPVPQPVSPAPVPRQVSPTPVPQPVPHTPVSTIPAPPVSKPKKKFTWAAAVAVLLVVLLAVGGAIVWRLVKPASAGGNAQGWTEADETSEAAAEPEEAEGISGPSGSAAELLPDGTVPPAEEDPPAETAPSSSGTGAPALEGTSLLNLTGTMEKFGKLWIRSSNPPTEKTHGIENHPKCWSDFDTLGYTQGPVRDNHGNVYTYGIHIDGDETGPYSMEFVLGGEYTRFTAVCAFPELLINEKDSPRSSKRVLILLDGVLSPDGPGTMSAGADPEYFEIDVTGVNRLTIKYQDTMGCNEAATLFDAQLFR